MAMTKHKENSTDLRRPIPHSGQHRTVSDTIDTIDSMSM